ncbi:neprosin family prolyl endopeptidase [Leptospira sp. 'Mane']|uniref:neprosin family prolyl endopeptidase n=1 Tax=Leptospira sp. 'Mane' TaxID=3387407 RepID=UPI00398A83CF
MKDKLLEIHSDTHPRASFHVNDVIVDCIPFEEQPWLRSHPEDIPVKHPSKEVRLPKLTNANRAKSHLGESGSPRCPENTIPKRRITLDDLTKHESLETFVKSVLPINPPIIGFGLPRGYATASQTLLSGAQGAIVDFSVWSPQTINKGDQSISQMWLTAGNNATFQSLETGWMVNRTVVQSGSSFPFYFWTPNDYQSGCINRVCFGVDPANPSKNLTEQYVQTSDSFIFAVPWNASGYSQKGQPPVFIGFSWHKDVDGTKWWHKYYCAPGNGLECQTGWQDIGYLPVTAFNGGLLSGSPDTLTVGGEVAMQSSTSPGGTGQMGSGDPPSSANSALQTNISWLDRQGNGNNVVFTSDTVTEPSCYNMYANSGSSSSYGTYITFGGNSCWQPVSIQSFTEACISDPNNCWTTRLFQIQFNWQLSNAISCTISDQLGNNSICWDTLSGDSLSQTGSCTYATRGRMILPYLLKCTGWNSSASALYPP